MLPLLPSGPGGVHTASIAEAPSGHYIPKIMERKWHIAKFSRMVCIITKMAEIKSFFQNVICTSRDAVMREGRRLEKLCVLWVLIVLGFQGSMHGIQASNAYNPL